MKKTFWLLPLLLAIPLFAVVPQFWETRTHDDFRKGKLTNLSLTTDDELVLAPKYEAVFNTEQTLIWSAVPDSKGNVYLGTGHDGKIYKVDSSGKGAMIADLAELDVLALAVDSKDVLYAGTSPDGKVYRIDAAGVAREFFDPKTKYIWSLVFDRQGRLLVGTGDRGIIFRVDQEGKGQTFYDTDETHIVSMTMDANGNLIAGGDPKGYIYRISPDGKAFVLYDSGMREVHSVAVGSNGTIYAAVISGETPIAPAPAPAAATDRASQGATPTVTVTLGSAEAAQTIEVIEPLDTVSPETPRAQTRRAGSAASAQSAILEITPDGVVNTIWRSPDEMVFSLLSHNGRVLFSTGTKGRIYAIDGPQSSTLLLESTEQQTTRLIETANRLYAASANIGKLFRIDDTLATSGEYESIVKDTDSVSTWGRVTMKGENQDLVQIATRSGNTNVPDKTWSDWTDADDNGAIKSPRARFVQWKAVLKSQGGKSPRLAGITVPYLQQNFRPEVTNVDVLPSGVALIRVPVNQNNVVNPNDPATIRASQRAGQTVIQRVPPRRAPQRGAQSFQWTATDKNQDTLTYDLYYRGDNERTWKVLRKDLTENFYMINSDTLPDGTYVVRIVANDLPSNPLDLAQRGDMESRPFSIDNTPPVTTMKLEGIDKGRVRVAIDAIDQTSTLNQAEVSIDTGEWQAVFPRDGIIDSKSESFTYLSGELSSGEHVIAFRIYDQNDNAGLAKVVVRIP
jgi:sugar lactone lactonase YvrE